MKKFPIKVVADKQTRRDRMSICMQCPLNKKGILCGKCGCLLSAKIALSVSRCPLKKW